MSRNEENLKSYRLAEGNTLARMKGEKEVEIWVMLILNTKSISEEQ